MTIAKSPYSHRQDTASPGINTDQSSCQHPKRNDWLALICAMVSVGLFASKAIIVKLSYEQGVHATTALSLRMITALPFFLTVGWLLHRSRHTTTPIQESSRTPQPHISGKIYLQIIGLGLVGYYLASWLDFVGLQYISAGLERMILYVYPTMVVLLQWMRGNRPSRLIIGSLIATYCGVVICLSGETFALAKQTDDNLTIFGSLLVLGSAVAFALYLVGAGEVTKHIGSARFTSIAFSAAGVGVMTHSIITGSFTEVFYVNQITWIYGIILGTCCTAIPAYALNFSLARLGSVSVAIIGCIGPVWTIGLAWWLLDEQPNLIQAGGMVLTISAASMMAWFQRTEKS